MKTKQRLLRFSKIKIAKINVHSIVGRGTQQQITHQCTPEESRPPSRAGRTQTASYDGSCEDAET
ncbi:MAG: hypothetical protein AAF611_09690 [Bacteroidota bacterium]